MAEAHAARLLRTSTTHSDLIAPLSGRSSDLSTAISSPTELQAWKYRPANTEQDEVLRKHRELRKRRCDAIWRGFWI